MKLKNQWVTIDKAPVEPRFEESKSGNQALGHAPLSLADALGGF